MLARCREIVFPKICHPDGNLTSLEASELVPFEIQRVFYMYDVPGGSERGGHAHQRLQQVMMAPTGSFDVTLDDGFSRRKYHLNRPYIGLYIPPMVWREMDNFSSNALCLVLASTVYDASDYYHDYDDFVALARPAHAIAGGR